MWSPILDLGADAHYWIDYFLKSWFLSYFNSGLSEEAFLSQWSAMIDHAFDAPGWSFTQPRKRYDLEAMWCSLMGFEGSLVTLWSKNQESCVGKMLSFYRQWGQHHLEKSKSFACFAAFLKQPAAGQLLPDGLIQLENALHARASLLGDTHVVVNLASLLAITSQVHYQRIQRQPEALVAFKKLLAMLAGIQNPLAMEIQTQLSITGSTLTVRP